MSKEFKAGDEVYYPLQGTQVFQLECYSGLNYPLDATFYGDDGDEDFATFTLEGFLSKTHKVPLLFHATPENKAKLEALYGVEFEAPPAKPTSHEIIKAKLDKGMKAVPCWVSHTDKQPTSKDYWAFIKKVTEEHTPYRDKDGYGWVFATPFDPHTVEAITELPT